MKRMAPDAIPTMQYNSSELYVFICYHKPWNADRRFFSANLIDDQTISRSPLNSEIIKHPARLENPSIDDERCQTI